MSDDGNGERATIRLVAEMVKGVSVQVDALKTLTESQHADTQRQLDGVTGLPIIVSGMIKHSERQDERLTALETKGTRAFSTWVSVMALLIAAASVVAPAFH